VGKKVDTVEVRAPMPANGCNLGQGGDGKTKTLVAATAYETQEGRESKVCWGYKRREKTRNKGSVGLPLKVLEYGRYRDDLLDQGRVVVGSGSLRTTTCVWSSMGSHRKWGMASFRCCYGAVENNEVGEKVFQRPSSRKRNEEYVSSGKIFNIIGMNKEIKEQ